MSSEVNHEMAPHVDNGRFVGDRLIVHLQRVLGIEAKGHMGCHLSRKTFTSVWVDVRKDQFVAVYCVVPDSLNDTTLCL